MKWPRSSPGALLRLTCLALLAGCAPHYQHLVERPLTSLGTLQCQGYLVWNEEPVRDVFLVINGSGILSNAFVHPSFDDVLSTRPAAYLTYDKPGVRAPFGDPAAVRRDDSMLERYTLGHGVACATSALHWAREQFGPSVRLHLRGHSEGTLVALASYDALFDSDAETGAAVRTLVLSGLALEPFDAILERQLATVPDGALLRDALASCDWRLLEARLGVSCAYVEDARRRPTGRALFERLAARAAGARFHVFQGTDDWNTPIEPVFGLEAWNSSEGHLGLTIHPYQGGHAGSDAAQAELAQLLTAIASP